jgi:hypothetical protein
LLDAQSKGIGDGERRELRLAVKGDDALETDAANGRDGRVESRPHRFFDDHRPAVGL